MDKKRGYLTSSNNTGVSSSIILPSPTVALLEPPPKRARGRPKQIKEPVDEATEGIAVSGTERLTQQILGALMTNDPLDLNDIIISTRTHFTGYVVQGILDILVVIGLVVKLHLREKTEDGGGFDNVAVGTCNGGVLNDSSPTKERRRIVKSTFYALKGYCRCSEAVDIRKLNGSHLLDLKKSNIESLEMRIQALQELTDASITPLERTQKLKSFVRTSLVENKALSLDPLYVVLNN